MTYVEPKLNKTAAKDSRIVNPSRYKYFLEHIQTLSRTGNSISLSGKVLNISRQTLYKYRNKAIKDNIISVIELGRFADEKTQTYYSTTYSIKKKIAMSFEVNMDLLIKKLEQLKGVPSDWTTNHRFDAYNRYLNELRMRKIIKKIEPIKNKGYEKARIDSHLYTKKIAYNPEEILKVLDIKYPFIRSYKLKVEEINKHLPEELKIKFDYKITPTNSGVYVKSISIRATNSCCNIISKQSKIDKLKKLNIHKRIKQDLLNQYGLIANPDCDTKSSILRLIASLYNGCWLSEDRDCYLEILKGVCKDTEITEEARNAFKPIVLSLFFAGSYRNAIKNLNRVLDNKETYIGKANNYLALTNAITGYMLDGGDEEDWDTVRGVMEGIITSFYRFLGYHSKTMINKETGKLESYPSDITLSGEIFLWESILAIDMIYEMYRQKPNLLCFLQYDGIYINAKTQRFRQLRKLIFDKCVLPLYTFHNCYNENEIIQINNYEGWDGEYD